MNTLDLTNKDLGDFKVLNYPDGQQQIVLIKSFTSCVLIKSRLNNFIDLELIICAVMSLRELRTVTEIHIFIPYFLGSRSDRRFQHGDNNYLKDVICPLINRLNFSSVTVLNPHSDVLEACLKNFEKNDGNYINKWALEQINNKPDAQDHIVFLSPDAGALKKIYKTAEYVNFTGEIICCNKSRDANGKITKTEVPQFRVNKDVVIFDDICDGGRTFIEIAKVLKQHGHSGKLYLVITHGIFSKGFDELNEYFDDIFCTDSYKNFFGQIKQFNIF